MAGRYEESFVHQWSSSDPPLKILFIRLQALGDVVITLPYLQALKHVLPSTHFQFFTREENADIPRALPMFEKVHTLGGGRNKRKQWMKLMPLIPTLLHEQYDCIIDLQRNTLSRMIRRVLRPRSFTEFDRLSPVTAGERTRKTINMLGFVPIPETPVRLEIRDPGQGEELLPSAGRKPGMSLIVLNPAGSFLTKNWPLQNYVEFAEGWTNTIDPNTQFLVLGMHTIREKVRFLKEKLGDRLIDLAERTTPLEAFNILYKTDLVVTEDSGLMHMAWVAQVPVVGLLGSTRSEWSKPIGRWSVSLDSSDLECGGCLQPTCQFGDVRCLTRYTALHILEIAKKLLNEKRGMVRSAE